MRLLFINLGFAVAGITMESAGGGKREDDTRESGQAGGRTVKLKKEARIGCAPRGFRRDNNGGTNIFASSGSSSAKAGSWIPWAATTADDSREHLIALLGLVHLRCILSLSVVVLHKLKR
ncbi:hypothetical protein NE237_019195 [Protea cynaroides]|uniref:Uncharacterized protein n=1 Tax=Protea cynaroides TaxID=273540 RepID=A0A9Q0KBB8_9MAGN|nr:hypothetical protein NE237_019195 [Protea cynaroides]